MIVLPKLKPHNKVWLHRNFTSTVVHVKVMWWAIKWSSYSPYLSSGITVNACISQGSNWPCSTTATVVFEAESRNWVWRQVGRELVTLAMELTVSSSGHRPCHFNTGFETHPSMLETLSKDARWGVRPSVCVFCASILMFCFGEVNSMHVLNANLVDMPHINQHQITSWASLKVAHKLKCKMGVSVFFGRQSNLLPSVSDVLLLSTFQSLSLLAKYPAPPVFDGKT